MRRSTRSTRERSASASIADKDQADEMHQDASDSEGSAVQTPVSKRKKKNPVESDSESSVVVLIRT
jgi:hypothetical protein